MFYLHGFMGSQEDFDFFPSSYTGLNYFDVPLVISLSKQWSMLVSHLWAQIEDTSPVTLFGYSMGGRIALAMFEAHPERVEKLILCGAQFCPPEDYISRNKVDNERALFLESDSKKFLEWWTTLPLFGPQETSMWKALKTRRLENIKTVATRWSYLLRVFSVSTQPDFSTLIKDHADKIVFIYGANDTKYAGFASDYRELGVETICVSNAWHAIHLDNPEGLLSALAAWT